MESPSSEVFQSCLDMELGNWLLVVLLEQGLGQVTFRVPCQPQPGWDAEILLEEIFPCSFQVKVLDSSLSFLLICPG